MELMKSTMKVDQGKNPMTNIQVPMMYSKNLTFLNGLILKNDSLRIATTSPDFVDIEMSLFIFNKLSFNSTSLLSIYKCVGLLKRSPMGIMFNVKAPRSMRADRNSN